MINVYIAARPVPQIKVEKTKLDCKSEKKFPRPIKIFHVKLVLTLNINQLMSELFLSQSADS